MSGQHHFALRPEKIEFERLLEACDSRLDRLAASLGVSSGTASKLVNGVPVRPSILQQVAERLEVPPTQLIAEDEETRIPNSSSAIREMKWGWFIDNDRFRGGEPKWFWERLAWDKRKDCGRIRNLHGVEYAFQVHRISQRLLTLTALETQGNYAFAATFTHYLPKWRVMHGIWSGVSDLGFPSVYRMFLSADKLSCEELQQISEAVKIDTVFAAGHLQTESR